ncbi:MAG: YceH family protein [Acidimicrobiales bacterium]
MSDFSSTGESNESFGEIAASAAGHVQINPPPTPGLISSSSAPAGGRVSQVWAESIDQADELAPQADVLAVAATVELSATESRVLGALIEKSYLTPDVYPMTTNGLVTACNQKTNRDPVVDYSAVLIDNCLLELRQRNLVRRVHSPGSRSTKHRQTLDEALALTERQLALVSVLLLRGPQTVGELRLRTERHDVGFNDLDAVHACLHSLESRVNPLVVELERRPGHKENRWQHLLGFDEPQDSNEHDATSSEPIGAPAASPGRASQLSSGHAAAGNGVLGSVAGSAEMSTRIDELEAQVATLQRQLGLLANKLGEPLE